MSNSNETSPAGRPVDARGEDALIEELRRSEAQLRLIYESAGDYAIITIDTERRVTSWSVGAERAFGWTADEMLGQSADTIFTLEDRSQDVPEHEVATAAATGCANDERWHQRKDGTRVFMNGAVHPLPRDAQGRLQGFIKIARDETDRRETQDRLRESEEFNRRMLAASADCIKVLDLDGRLEFMSEGGMCVMEVDDFGAIEGACWPDFWTGEEHAKALAAMAEAKRGGVGRFQGRAPTLKGHMRWWDVIVSPINGADGRPEKLLSVSRDISATQEAQASVSETEERYRLAARATNDAIWDWRMADGHVIWNEALADRFGHQVSETSAQWWLDHIHPDDLPKVDRDIHAVIDGTGNDWSCEYRFLRADGRYADVFDRGHVLRDAEGNATRMIGAMLDLTERKAAEAELVRANALLTAVMEAVPGVVYAKDAEGRMLAANRGTAELIGKKPAEFIGRTDAEFLDDKEQAAAVMANDRRIMASGETEVLEETVNGPDGSRIVWLSTKAPFRDAAGEVIGLVGASIDITSRKVAEEQLWEINDTLETEVAQRTAERDRMWETSPDLMVIVDKEGIFRRVNPAWTVVLSYAVEELVGHHYSEFLLEEDHAQADDTMAALAEGQPARVEDRYRHKDGSYRWIAWVAAPAGDVTYATGRDVTAEKEAAAELERAQDALRQAQKMEAVGQLTGGLAHDFNNLLAGISGSLELMGTRLAQGRIDEIDKYLIAAQGAAKRAAALTHRLLAFSRRQTLDPKPTNIGALVSGMEDLVRRTVGPAINVESVAGGGVWSVLVDPNQLENALLNLCINARDAMPDGGKITIETANRWIDERAAKTLDLPAGQFVSLCVSDNGAGMTADVVSKAFDPFFTTKPIGMGTGLGLSMIYGFARQSGGQVRIYSEPGKGTMVCIYLPRHHSEEAAAAATDMPASPTPAPGGSGTVLVIDDEPLVRMLVVDALSDLGYDAIEAEDGPSGLKVLRSERAIDLLITDVGLPNGMNGRQVADAARELRPELKVLFITGFAENAVLNHGHLDHGMQVITKPFAVSDLGERIRAMMAPG